MVKHLLRRCTVCGKYTLEADNCPRCDGVLKMPHPAKFSPDDRYAKYRQKAMESPKDENFC